MVTGDAGLDTEVLTEVPTHAFAEQFLPTVTILGHGGISVLFFESGDMGIALFVRVIDTRGGSVEVALDTELFRGHEQMGIDKNRQHAKASVVLDETHAPHVRSQIVNDTGVPKGRFTGMLVLQVELKILDFGEALVPFLKRLDVDGADGTVPLAQKFAHEMAADESAATTHHNSFRAHSSNKSVETLRT
jgi:hypothetical protein